jgi:m7GpppX diphosphatase
VTLPFIESENFSIDWVYNILNHSKESERIIYEDPDPDTGSFELLNHFGLK